MPDASAGGSAAPPAPVAPRAQRVVGVVSPPAPAGANADAVQWAAGGAGAAAPAPGGSLALPVVEPQRSASGAVVSATLGEGGGVVRAPFGACVSVPPGVIASPTRVRVSLSLCEDAPTLAPGGAACARWLAAGPSVAFDFTLEEPDPADADGAAGCAAVAACARVAALRVPHGAHPAATSRLRLLAYDAAADPRDVLARYILRDAHARRARARAESEGEVASRGARAGRNNVPADSVHADLTRKPRHLT